MRLYLTTITLLLLTACGGGYQTGLATAQVNGALERENRAIQRADELSATQCPGSKDSTGEEFLKHSKCWVQIVEQNVTAEAYDPILFSNALTDLKMLNLKYEQGEITYDELKLLGRKTILSYEEAKRAKAMGTLNRANQIDMQVAQQQQQYFQNLSQQIQQQETMQARQCSSIDIAPMASLGCRNVCINGNWAEVCG